VKTIYKYPVAILDEQLILLPVGAEILTVSNDPHGALCLWAVVNPLNPTIPRTINIVGTGQPMPDANVNYITTLYAANFVWHVFEQLHPNDIP
jgi:hypothetical protein